ncbi:hypothetical protein BZL30_4129 [Mycobacterium kansasii]|uniref:Uncharacterized protein n=1 Tax=Mycobacterium kansasii TaxID=1768 RepID=A0A1V3X9Z1_MYCKA|nr:hypothetical protein BZL30_4129 [Mycobacterium kansasii]
MRTPNLSRDGSSELVSPTAAFPSSISRSLAVAGNRHGAGGGGVPARPGRGGI